MAKKQKGLQFYKRKKKVNKSIVNEIFLYLLLIAIAVFLAWVGNYFYGTTTNMVGISMAPTLQNEQEVLVDKFCYILGSPKRGDVIAFLPKGNENSHYYIKRVIAIPGDHVQIVDGVVYVNGLESKLVTEKVLDAGTAANVLTLENGQYFVMGDNPNYSEDSRSANVGTVAMDDILGRIWFRIEHGDTSSGFITKNR